MVAVNICDLDEYRGKSTILVIQLLLQDFVEHPLISVDAEPGMVDGMAIALNGPAANDQQRLNALVEYLHWIGRRKIRRPIRCYRQGKRGGWTRIPAARRADTRSQVRVLPGEPPPRPATVRARPA